MLKQFVEETYGHEYDNIELVRNTTHCFKATCRTNPTLVAFFKVFDFAQYPKKRLLYNNEIRVLRLLEDASYVSRLISTLVEEERHLAVIVQEYVDHDDLIDRINNEMHLQSASHVSFVRHFFAVMIHIRDGSANGMRYIHLCAKCKFKIHYPYFSPFFFIEDVFWF